MRGMVPSSASVTAPMIQNSCRRPVGLCLSAVALFVSTGAAGGAEDRQLALLKTQHAEARREYAEKLGDFARDLEAVGGKAAAAEAWKLAVPPQSKRIVLEKLPRKVRPEPSLELPQAERGLLVRLAKVRRDHAIELYQFSRRAMRSSSIRYAYELLREAAAQDPDYEQARKILGYVRDGDEWLTPFEKRMRNQGKVWSEKFGWLPADDVARYEAGERFDRGRWITAEQDAELHRDFKNPWEVRTEHYVVKTNHSLGRGVEIASRLETFREFFVETFAGFFTRPEDLRILFGGNGVAKPVELPPHEVHYYRTRQEYNERLVTKEAKIGQTNGLYFTSDRVAYFYHEDGRTNDDTLYHEATHQLLYECMPKLREVGTQAHFWVIEGFACYMESFRPGEGIASLGDPRHVRIAAARYRYVDEGHYTPFGKFAAMGLYDFQTVPLEELQRNYSQAAGMAHFLMHYDGGKYRDALIEHLAQLYHGVRPPQRTAQNLAELTKVPYTELDRQYGEYMKGLAGEKTAARE